MAIALTGIPTPDDAGRSADFHSLPVGSAPKWRSAIDKMSICATHATTGRTFIASVNRVSPLFYESQVCLSAKNHVKTVKKDLHPYENRTTISGA